MDFSAIPHAGRMSLGDWRGILWRGLVTSKGVSSRWAEPCPPATNSCYVWVNLAFPWKCSYSTAGWSLPACWRSSPSRALVKVVDQWAASATRQTKTPSFVQQVPFCRKLPSRCSFREGSGRSSSSDRKTFAVARPAKLNCASLRAWEFSEILSSWATVGGGEREKVLVKFRFQIWHHLRPNI